MCGISLPAKHLVLLNNAGLGGYLRFLVMSASGAYWPLQETTGAVAVAFPNTTMNGSIQGATVGQTATSQLVRAYLFDGNNDYVDIYSAALNSAFSSAKGTLLAFAKVSAAGVWTDSAFRRIATVRTDASNYITIYKSNANNTMSFIYTAGGTADFVNATSLSYTNYFLAGITWDTAADAMKAYLNGVQTGTTQSTLGTWVGALSSTQTNIGTLSAASQQPWSGNIAHVMLLTSVLTPAQMLQVAQLGGVA